MLIKPKHNQIKLNNLSLNLHLGWPEEERQEKQEVSVDIILKFSTMPPGCETDDLTDTICYDHLTKTITQHCQVKSYKLIEHLAYDIYQQIKLLHTNIDCQVAIHKQPLIANLLGGARFICGDWL